MSSQFLSNLQVIPLAALLFISFAAPASADIDTRGAISNFENFAPNLYRGSQPSFEALKELRAKGVKTIINLRLDREEAAQEKAWCAKHGINYVGMPMGFKTPKQKEVLSFLGIVTDPKMQPVYLHCRYGSDRTGTMVGLYRVIVQNWSFDKAYAEMRKHHFKPFLSALKHSVRDYSLSKPADKEQLLANSRRSGQVQ
ncbi:MAG: tyrosine-protein phosphatase [Candidatus Obscuribacterales bacterium]|nr:tyrosine-protein phosphatase [Candidatus Obscuribacterales bacterium]